MNVIVLGLGAMGTAAAMHLARSGARVVGIEARSIGHDLGSSHGETRLIRKAYFESAAYVPLLERSYECWRDLERVSGESLLHETGLVMFGPGVRSRLDAARATAERHGIPVEVLDGASCHDRFETFPTARDHTALWEPTGGWLAVERCLSAHARAARDLGADLHENEPAISWSASDHGVRVTTERAEYEADRLVITAGPWAPQLLADLSLPLRVHRVPLLWFPTSSPAWFDAPCFAFDLPKGFFYGFPSLDGSTIKIAMHVPGAECSPEDVSRTVTADDARPVESFVRAHLAHVDPSFVRGKVCLYTMTPDEHFVIDLHPAHSNVSLAAGFSGHGFKFAPVVGECLAELALRGETRHPIDFLRIKRG